MQDVEYMTIRTIIPYENKSLPVCLNNVEQLPASAGSKRSRQSYLDDLISMSNLYNEQYLTRAIHGECIGKVCNTYWSSLNERSDIPKFKEAIFPKQVPLSFLIPIGKLK